MRNNTLKEIWQEIKNRDNFLLIGHEIPDGDCVGSLLAFYQVLKAHGKKVSILLPQEVPEIYHYLAEVDKVQLPENYAESCENVIFLDCAEITRVGNNVLKKIADRQFTINIDHHKSNDYFGDVNYVDASAAATGEILTNLFRSNEDIDITADIANALYAAIIMDTGNFQYSSTTSDTFKIAAYLVEKGADINETRINLFESKNPKELLLIKQALTHLEFSPAGKIAWLSLSYEEVKKIDALNLHPEGIIKFPRSVKGIEIAIQFREIEPGKVKMGFRSKESINVAEIASFFGGGGHMHAAGAQQIGDLEQVIDNVISYVTEYLKGVLD